MELGLYFATIFLSQLASYGYAKSCRYLGERPIRGTFTGVVYELAGAFSWLIVVGFFVYGFFLFTWWIPLAVVLTACLGVGIVYQQVPAGAAYAILAFPLATLLGLIWLLLA